MSHTIFVTARTLSPEGLAILDREGCRTLFLEGDGSPAEVERILRSEKIDGVISRTVALTREAIVSCGTLKVVSKHGVGVNNIDVASCTERQIPVFSTPGANAQSVAEMAVGLMLSAARSIPHMDSEIKAGQWPRRQNGLELKGRTVGLIGYGQIGRIVARICQAIGMHVCAYDPYAKAADMQDGVELTASLDDLLARAQILSLHVPLTQATQGLIGKDQLALLPEQAIVVNTARGEVVDEIALIEALRSKKLFAAGLDTTAVEPTPADSPLRQMSNVVLTPHVGGSTPAALAAMAVGAVNNALGYLKRNEITAASVVNYSSLNLQHKGT